MKNSKIAYILGSFPAGIAPFIANEIKGLKKEGINIFAFPIHKTKGSDSREDNGEINAIYADPIFSPKIIIAHLFFMFCKPVKYFKLLIRNNAFGGKRVFWEGVYYAKIIKKLGIKHVHAHFAWEAADCARIIKGLSGIPFSLTAHQSDIHRTPERLYEKLSEAKFILTCTKGNKEYLVRKYGREVNTKIFTVYHGVDVGRFLPEVGENEKDIDILSIGTLIKIKGFEYLINACALLRGDRYFKKCVIVGEGGQRNSLESLIKEMGLKDKIEIRKPVSYDEVINLYKRTKIFVAPFAVINGAPHGIPNVIPEAMAMGLAVIVFNVPHISEIIENEKNGLLVFEKDIEGLATSIVRLLADRELRFRFGINARKKIIMSFNLKEQNRKIANLFMQNI